ncbi:hypothetical protein FWH58_01705 [Candidatus Saccharibacteria bacterium]|nr:hypothetical protein [Candidatus Saccharibacteria bacterium]
MKEEVRYSFYRESWRPYNGLEISNAYQGVAESENYSVDYIANSKNNPRHCGWLIATPSL